MELTRKVYHVFFIIFLFIIIPVEKGRGSPDFKIQRIDPNKDFPLVELDISIAPDRMSKRTRVNNDTIAIFEDGYRVTTRSVRNLSGNDGIIYLVISIDSSKSISRKFLDSIKASTREIIKCAGLNDKIALYRFNDTVSLIRGFTDDKRELIRDIDAIERCGRKTLLYDAVYDSIKLLKEVEKEDRAVIVFTDGKDEGSSVTAEDVIELSQHTGIPIYFLSLKKSRNLNTMARIAKLTNGKLIYSNTHRDVSDMYRKIISYMKNRYRIHFHSRNKQEGQRHFIEIILDSGKQRYRDSIYCEYKKSNPFLDLSNSAAIIFMLIIVILLLFICFILFFFLRREKKILDSITDRNIPVINTNYDKLIELEEVERKNEAQILTSLDPEYTYANAWLIEKDGPESGKKFPIYWDEVTIGSAKDNSIVVDDSSVSLNHAKIKNIRKSYHIFDLVSENGTYLNGKKLLRPKALYDWDEVQIGRSVFIFRGSKRTH